MAMAIIITGRTAIMTIRTPSATTGRRASRCNGRRRICRPTRLTSRRLIQRRSTLILLKPLSRKLCTGAGPVQLSASGRHTVCRRGWRPASSSPRRNRESGRCRRGHAARRRQRRRLSPVAGPPGIAPPPPRFHLSRWQCAKAARLRGGAHPYRPFRRFAIRRSRALKPEPVTPIEQVQP